MDRVGLNFFDLPTLTRRAYFDSDNATAVYGDLPPGVFPNFVNPVSRAKEIVLANVLCIVLCLVLVSARLYSKYVITKTQGWDDVTCVLGFVFAVFYGACVLAMTTFGLGRHQWDIPHSWLSGYLFWAYMTNFYWLSAAASKTSVLLFYLRIFKQNSRLFKWSCIGMIVFINLLCFGCMIALLLECDPVRSAWSTVPVAKCWDTGMVTLVATALCIVQDFILLIMPMPVLSSLHVPSRQRLAVVAIFLTGTLATLITGVRLNTLVVGAKSTLDYTWDYFDAYLWTVVELFVFVMVACLPIMKPFARKMAPRVFGSQVSQDSKYPQSRDRSGGSVSSESSTMSKVGTSFRNFGWTNSVPYEKSRSGSFTNSSMRSENMGKPSPTYASPGSMERKYTVEIWTDEKSLGLPRPPFATSRV